MKAFILNGAMDDHDATDCLASTLAEGLLLHGWQVEVVTLRQQEIAWCTGCFGCWSQEPGECVIDDAGRVLAAKVRQAQLVVFLTPVTFGGYSSQLKKAVDRLLPDMAPYFMASDPQNIQHAIFPALLGVGVLDREDDLAASLFLSLVERNAANYHSCCSSGLVVAAGIDPHEFARRLEPALTALEVCS